jgi:ATP-binding cassette subfamily B protein
MSRRLPTKGFSGEVRLMLKRARQVWHLVPRRHKWALAGAAVVMALTSLFSTAMPLLLGRLVDDIKQGTDQHQSVDVLLETAALFLGLIAGAYLLREALNVLRRYLVENSCTRINREMSVKLMSHLLKVDLASLAHEKVGALHGRIFRSVDGFMRFLRIGFLDFFPAVLTGMFALLAAVTKQPLLGVVMVGVIPTAVFLTVRQLISQKGVRLQLMRTCEEIDAAVVEQLGGIEYVRAANTYPLEIKRLARATEKRRIKENRHHFQMSLFGAAKALNEGFFHVVVIALSIYLFLHGQITFGDMTMFPVLFLNVMAPLSEVHRVLDEGHEASLRVSDLLEMLAEPLDQSFAATVTREPRLVEGQPAVVVDNLRMEYLTSQGQTLCALDGIALMIRHGETIGVAGRTGSGKSTWLKCLLRLTHACGGNLALGGVPLAEVSREALGRLIGYVGQLPFVFAGTIAENIAYGNPHATPEDIRRAAELAYLHDEIMQMPGGYDAEVTERGQNLSGGQRQRLAIARILLKQPPILILDEATSALDNISERHVQRALGVIGRDRTTILVAHRLSTLRDADRIYVFDDGHIVEVGAYHELVQRGGAFTALVMSAENGVGGSDGPPDAVEPAAAERVAAPQPAPATDQQTCPTLEPSASHA